MPAGPDDGNAAKGAKLFKALGMAYERAQRRYSRERNAILTEMQALAPSDEDPFEFDASPEDRPFPGLP